MATPAWSAARAGLLGDTGAVDASAQINQLLGTHAGNEIYLGNSILTPNGSGGTAWAYQLSTQDIDQPFTMSGTAIGRVTLPLLPVGNGADLIVSLCANNAGNPGTVVAQTRVPAAWITQLAAVSGVAGPSSAAPTLQYTNKALATAQFNGLHLGAFTAIQLLYPTVQLQSSCPFGAYTIWTGGQTTVGANAVSASVFTVQMDSVGNASQPVPQPSLPAAVFNHGQAVAVEANGGTTLVVTGGATNVAGSALTSAVFTAAFNAGTGVLSPWSSQQSLPTTLAGHGCAASGAYLYVIGGNAAGAVTSAVSMAQVQNGQITAWSAVTSLPQALYAPYAAVCNGFLIVTGGSPNTSGSPVNASTYYAPVNADGTLGTWQAGPSMPGNIALNQFAPALTLDTYGVMLAGSTNTPIPEFLGVGAYGPDTAFSQDGGVQNADLFGLVSNGNGTWQYYGFGGTGTATVSLTPRISVPLAATGLSNGATYHVLLQQPNGDLNNYLRTHDDLNVFPGNPTVLTRAKGASTWTAAASGHAVPIQIYDNSNGTSTPGAANNQVIHTWEDSGARISTLVRSTTPDQRLLGLLEATAQPAPVLNQWPTFAQGLGPWTGTGGTLTQSNAFTHGGLPFSAKLTPSGVDSLSYLSSEQVTAQQGHSYVASAWLYSPTGYSNITVSVNWFSNGTYNSTTAGSVISIPANTWTLVQTTAPTPAIANPTLTINPIEGGTPPATAIFYVANATIQDTSGPMLSSVAQINHSGAWPGTGVALPTGVTALA